MAFRVRADPGTQAVRARSRGNSRGKTPGRLGRIQRDLLVLSLASPNFSTRYRI